MKLIWKEMLLAAMMGLVLPGAMLGIAATVETPETIIEITTGVPTEATQAPIEKRSITVPILAGGQVVQMELDEYLTGVVLGEMPASFEEEALKAQAVVARTYTMRAQHRGGRHDAAAVCTDSTCCQSYISPSDYLAAGGTQNSVDRIRNAVLATSGQVLTYEGDLIEATYFSCSGGVTEDAAAVWGADYPYLKSVSSPGEEKAAHYTDTVVFTASQFESALGRDLSGTPSGWFGVTTYTTGGGVATMEIGGEVYQGTDLRTMLGLRSTAFMVSADLNSVTITTKGFGHRVGMSQYGADAMAVLGSTYAQILAHYYQGTSLTTLEN
ncbi:MAG: stage II sporulation protein D [Oscillospiraceae bacterium]|nr:stage II sporulation protein D [Oscillospiraceae bacterium]